MGSRQKAVIGDGKICQGEVIIEEKSSLKHLLNN